jgi:formylglycine-generating enzyme required for sulfatase activity
MVRIRTRLVVGLLASIGLMSQVAEAADKKYALLVGVDRYGEGALLPPLNFPGRDVEGLAEVLIESGYERDNVVVMIQKDGSKVDYQPSARKIRKQLSLLLKGMKPGDSIIVLLAGHGVMMDIPPPGGGKPASKSLFCASDANLADKDLTEFVPIDEVFDALKNCPATTKLLLVDACRNELKPKNAEGRLAGINMPAPPPPPASVAALFSCAEGEVSWQDANLGGGHGVFSHFVIEGLKGKADEESGNKDGSVTLDELTGYVKENVFQFVRVKHATSQEPRLLVGSSLGRVMLRDRVSVTLPEFVTSKASGIKLKLIPAGKFLMGSNKADDADAFDNEQPRHEVRLTRSFYLGVTEVTQGQYRTITGESPSNFKGSDDLPVEQVSWFDAVKYCNALGVKEGLPLYYRIDGDSVTVPDAKGPGYRLPTEAEWEYACRGGRSTRYSFGDDAADLGSSAWSSENSGSKTHPVGEKRPNAFGLYDMHGNVYEWCQDWYDKDYYAQSPLQDPPGPVPASVRVFRGGCWILYPRLCRSAYRSGYSPAFRFNDGLGFRLALVQSSR